MTDTQLKALAERFAALSREHTAAKVSLHDARRFKAAAKHEGQAEALAAAALMLRDIAAGYKFAGITDA